MSVLSRIGGKDPYEVSSSIAETLLIGDARPQTAKTCFIVPAGRHMLYALAAASPAANSRSPLLYVTTSSIPSTVLGLLRRHFRSSKLVIAGDRKAVGTNIEEMLKEKVSGRVLRYCSGPAEVTSLTQLLSSQSSSVRNGGFFRWSEPSLRPADTFIAAEYLGTALKPLPPRIETMAALSRAVYTRTSRTDSAATSDTTALSLGSSALPDCSPLLLVSRRQGELGFYRDKLAPTSGLAPSIYLIGGKERTDSYFFRR